jgi:hypothetical protein
MVASHRCRRAEWETEGSCCGVIHFDERNKNVIQLRPTGRNSNPYQMALTAIDHRETYLCKFVNQLRS